MNPLQLTKLLKTALKNTLLYQLWRGHPTLQFTEIAKARISRVILPRRLSVGWVLCGDKQVGSSRIHGLNLHHYLRSYGASSFVINEPSGYIETLDIDDFAMHSILKCKFDVVVLQRVHLGGALKLIKMLNEQGTKTAFFVADLYESEAYKHTNYIFTASNSLKMALLDRGILADRIHVIPDAIETAPNLCKAHSKSPQNTIKLVWVGAAGHWGTLTGLRQLLQQDERLRDFRLVTISNHPEANVQWDLETVWTEILKCDVGVIPVNIEAPESAVKSNNRATMFKALGMPIICSRLPSYEEVIVTGQTGYFADTPEEWITSLLALVDPDNRQKIGLNGRHSALDKYGISRIGKDFLDLLVKITDTHYVANT